METMKINLTEYNQTLEYSNRFDFLNKIVSLQSKKGKAIKNQSTTRRAKKIKNEARINEDVDERALLRKYEIELKKLK